ncbi:hypothetical protein [Mycobacterium tuberculosis]|uniref:hypothetical protein n=1 Tax=Mycobacterium tuberculosis TaxID=1773 RepID=UPI00345B1CA0
MSGDDAGPGEVSHARGVGGPGGAGGAVAGWMPAVAAGRSVEAARRRAIGRSRRGGRLEEEMAA